MTDWDDPRIRQWGSIGSYRHVLGHEIFVADLPAETSAPAEPLFVIHGYPTSSFDFGEVATRLAARRPIAVTGMANRLREARPDADLRWIPGAGHYPQIEDPETYLVEVEAALGRSDL